MKKNKQWKLSYTKYTSTSTEANNLQAKALHINRDLINITECQLRDRHCIYNSMPILDSIRFSWQTDSNQFIM